MKNILVDVLRQAQNESGAGDVAESVVPCDAVAQITMPERDQSGDSAHERLDDPATGDLELLRDDAETPARDVPFPEVPEVEPHLIQTRHLTEAGARLEDAPSFFIRFSRVSPFVCLAAMSVSVGAYVLYQNLAAVNLNGDLSELSSLVALDAVSEKGSRQAMPDIESVFVFGGGAAEVSRTVSTEGSHPPTKHPSQALQPRIVENQRVTAGETDRAYPIVVRAYDAYRDQDLVTAERIYREALEISPHNADALGGLATVLSMTLRNDEATAVYERLLVADPQNAVAISAVLARAIDRPALEIESEMKLLLQKFPDSPHLHFALGLQYAGNGQWPEANYQFTLAQRLNPAKADYSYNLAVSLEQLGRTENAASFYEKALLSADAESVFDRQLTEQHLQKLTASWGEF